MKALILAAGFGTRLLPHTAATPKPLFTLNGIPIIQICIERLIYAGCTDIIINTHHLSDQIQEFVDRYKSESTLASTVNITTIHEPTILNTGGAIRNVRNFMGSSPFIVINSDIISDIDLKKVWNFHLSLNDGSTLNNGNTSQKCCATLVLHDCHIFNKVVVSKNMFVNSFSSSALKSEPASIDSGLFADKNNQLLAFTGVQVLSPEIFDYIYSTKDKIGDSQNAANSSSQLQFATEPFSSIDLYSHLAEQGDLVKAFVCTDIFWQDIGTPETYRDTAIKFLSARQLNSNTSNGLKSESYDIFPFVKRIITEKLAGDGSDRGWFRCRLSDNPELSVIVADHGIYNRTAVKSHDKPQEDDKPQEIDSFIDIGNHLYKQGISVPHIKGYDRFAGLVVLNDLGDVHLQDFILKIRRDTEFEKDKENLILEHYKRVCDLAINFSIKGIDGFDDSWTFQTPSYSKDMILEKECLYFVEAFLQGYLKLDVKFDDFIEEFEFIADNALDGAFEGLMHRDMQSRNIMVKDGNYFFIDFQSARRGPLQYDLASLLIDPYVNLSDYIKESVLYECRDNIGRIIEDGYINNNFFSRYSNYRDYLERFIKCYRYCALTRNMQMLGAFGNLSTNKGKSYFEQYIPVALKNLKTNVNFVDTNRISRLYSCITKL